MMDRDTATMVAATMTAATFSATMPSATQARREGWTAAELQRVAWTAGTVAFLGAAVLAAVSRSGDPLYVTAALGAGLALVYQLAAGVDRGR